MLTTNTNLEDRLVNGLVSKLMGFKSTDSTVKVIYVQFNDEKARAMQRDNVARQNCLVPVLKGGNFFLSKK